jgi:predicted lipid-binding transport protein (Tim44 family)
MSSAIIQLLVLAGIAVFLIIRLRSVLGTRDGFEKPPVPISDRAPPGPKRARPEFDVIEGGPDRDILDHVPDGSDAAKALAAMKMAEDGFHVGEFLDGAKGAYEMILMAFENGDLSEVEGFLAPDVAEAFQSVIDQRADQGLTVHADFVGVREISLVTAAYDRDTGEGEMTVRFVGEMTSVVRNEAGEVVEGNPNEIKRQRDVWTFSRHMGSADPNWHLVATGE